MKTFLVWLLLVTPAIAQFGQLDVQSGTFYQLSGVETIAELGGKYLVEDVDGIGWQPVAIVEVKTEAANVEVLASDVNREPVKITELEPNVFAIYKQGKFWVEITAVDFEKNIYGRKTVVVEVGEGAQPPPEPDDGDEDEHQVVTDFKGWFVFVEETADAQPWLTKIKQSTEWNTLEALGIKRRFYDDDQPEAAAYVEMVKQAGLALPVMFLVEERSDGSKAVIKKLPMPQTMKEIRGVVGR